MPKRAVPINSKWPRASGLRPLSGVSTPAAAPRAVEPIADLRGFPAATETGGALRRGPPTEGNGMYSIFYIIGVIVVILAVLQLIA